MRAKLFNKNEGNPTREVQPINQKTLRGGYIYK